MSAAVDDDSHTIPPSAASSSSSSSLSSSSSPSSTASTESPPSSSDAVAATSTTIITTTTTTALSTDCINTTDTISSTPSSASPNSSTTTDTTTTATITTTTPTTTSSSSSSSSPLTPTNCTNTSTNITPIPTSINPSPSSSSSSASSSSSSSSSSTLNSNSTNSMNCNINSHISSNGNGNSSNVNSSAASSISKLLDNSLVEVMEALETLLIYTKNLILYPDEKKYRKIKISNVHYQERLGHLQGAIEAMSAIGYLPQGEYLRLDEARFNVSNRDSTSSKLKQMELFILEQLNQIKQRWGTLPNRLMNDHQYVSVQGAAVFSSIGKRHNMEDDEIIVDRFCGEPRQGYFGLYDGHGGRATVDFVVKALHMNLEQHLKRNPHDALAEAFKQAYLATDGQLRRQNILRSGTTSVTCVIRVTGPDKKTLFTANVGDSRAVLCRAGRALRLTVDHKASLPEEAKRITDAGGFIGRNKRVNGVLAISRALGDHMLKENDIVSAEPYCCSTELQSDDSLIILACDGVWDVMTDQEAVDFVQDRVALQLNKLSEFRAANPNFVFPPISIEAQAAAAGLFAQPTDGSDSPTNNNTTSTTNTTNSNSNNQPHSNLASPPINGTGTEEEITTPRNTNEALFIVARALVKEALDRRSLDNVTVMLVKL